MKTLRQGNDDFTARADSGRMKSGWFAGKIERAD
jgi:hypothetical protein